LNGIFNITAIYQEAKQDYLIFEFDSRMNIWAHISIDFGFRPNEYFIGANELPNNIKRDKVYVNKLRWKFFLRNNHFSNNAEKTFYLLKTIIEVITSRGKFIN
jgi:hypothetical protein